MPVNYIQHVMSETNRKKFENHLLNPYKLSSRATNRGVNEKVPLQKYVKETVLQVNECHLFISIGPPHLNQLIP